MPMPQSPTKCPMDSLLRLLMGPWTTYILWVLHSNGPTRFGELKRRVAGISAKMLTERLRMLEEAGMVLRDHQPTVPPQVTYSLTPRGQELRLVLDELLAGLRASQKHKGGVPSPFECWLALRGVQSLAPRMAVHCANALALARFLAGHPAVEVVHYPGLPTHPGHAVAVRQMSAFGGMLSFQVKGGQREAMAVAARVKLLTRATSLGGAHSLIEHRASVEGPGTMAPPNLLRVSVGLEHVDDLREDLEQALEAARP